MKMFLTLYKSMSQISTLLKSLLQASEDQKHFVNSQSQPTKLLKAEQNYLKFSNSYKNSKTPTPKPTQPKTNLSLSPMTSNNWQIPVYKNLDSNFDWGSLDDLLAAYAKGTLDSYSLGQKPVKQPSLPAKSPTLSTRFLNRTR